MQYQVFIIPVLNHEESIEKLNGFLRGHKIVQVDKQMIVDGLSSFWAFCVTYLDTPSSVSGKMEKKEKIDYKNVLSEHQFAIFSQLRSFRKEIASDDAVPAYAVFTDAELAALSQADELNEKTILSIDGIGKSRLEKYGIKLLKKINCTDNQSVNQ